MPSSGATPSAGSHDRPNACHFLLFLNPVFSCQSCFLLSCCCCCRTLARGCPVLVGPSARGHEAEASWPRGTCAAFYALGLHAGHLGAGVRGLRITRDAFVGRVGHVWEDLVRRQRLVERREAIEA